MKHKNISFKHAIFTPAKSSKPYAINCKIKTEKRLNVTYQISAETFMTYNPEILALKY